MLRFLPVMNGTKLLMLNTKICALKILKRKSIEVKYSLVVSGWISQMLSLGCSQLHTDDGGVSFNGGCYKYVAEKKTRSEAAKACNVNDGV